MIPSEVREDLGIQEFSYKEYVSYMKREDKELELLKEIVKDFKKYLYEVSLSDKKQLNSSEVFEFAGKLDRLIAEFLKVKEKVNYL